MYVEVLAELPVASCMDWIRKWIIRKYHSLHNIKAKRHPPSSIDINTHRVQKLGKADLK